MCSKNTKTKEIVYDECHCITVVAEDAFVIRNFIVNRSMRLAIFNEFVNLKMLTITKTRFSVIVMLKRFKAIRKRSSEHGN